MTQPVEASLGIPGGDPAMLDDLAAWIREARPAGVRVQGKRATAGEGAMGLGLVETLTVSIGAVTATVELVKALHGWMTARRSSAPSEVVITGPDGIVVSVKGAAPLAELIAQAQAAHAAMAAGRR